MVPRLLPTLCCLLALLCAGCGDRGGGRGDTRDGGTEVVRFWVMGYEGEQVAQLLPEFERRHPGIRVEL
ncbi:MAG TPA: hypothetical protein VGC43_00225, partial [Luteimonas sp.]